MNNLPEMTVELRVSNTAHEVPHWNTFKGLDTQIQETLQLNQDYHSSNWADTTIDILNEYFPFGDINIRNITHSVRDVANQKSWKEVSIFVQNDMCLEWFNHCLKYVLSKNQPHVQELGFIDGSGIGYAKVYIEDLKISLEKAFDVKYYYKLKRPLEYALGMGMDLTQFANWIHPGHWSYCAGHGTKFFQVIETLDKIFVLQDEVYRTLLVASYVNAMGRSGSLIHFPMDNIASSFLFPELRTKANSLF